MNVDVTRLATCPNQHRLRRRTQRHVAPGHENGGMAVLRVALLAQHGARRRQERLKIRSVRIVAVQAILADRCMLEEEWSALFGVAAVTNLVDAVGLEQRRGR